MLMSDYSRNALKTESPVGNDTITRYVQLGGVITSEMKRALAVTTPFDKFKREIFYKPPGDSESNFAFEAAPEARSCHAMLGILSEVHELLEAYLTQEEIDPVHLTEELGDLLWYINLFAVANDINLSTVAARNIAKLHARNKEKGTFDQEGTLNRDLENERKILEGKEE